MYYAINCMHDGKHMGVRAVANKKIVFATLIGFIKQDFDSFNEFVVLMSCSDAYTC